MGVRLAYQVSRCVRPRTGFAVVTPVFSFTAQSPQEACEVFLGRFKGGCELKGEKMEQKELVLFGPDGCPIFDPTYTYKTMTVYKSAQDALKHL